MCRLLQCIYGEVLGRCGVGGGLLVAYIVLLFTVASVTRGGVAVSNIIASGANRAIVNTSIHIGKRRDGNDVASVGNGCRVISITSGTALVFDCVNVHRRRVTMGKHSAVGIGVRRSDRLVSRIIMINCNDTGGHSLANSVIAIGTSRVTSGPSAGPLTSVRNGITNMRIIGANHTKRSPRVHIHNAGSVGNFGPLCIMSKLFASGVGCLGATSVRSVRVLGSPSSLTVFNIHNTGNMVVVAAGETGVKGAVIGVGSSIN